MPIEQAIDTRRSCRHYSNEGLSLNTLVQLLWAAQGTTGNDGTRAAPSAGAQYPLRLYIIAGHVDNLAKGLYFYDEKQHALELISDDVQRAALRAAALEDQPWIGDAAAIIVISADMPSMRAHFHEQPPPGKRGERYVYMETGAVAENVHLQATALGVGLVWVGGFDDAKVKKVLHLRPELKPTALLCIGPVA
nr:SagB/ThcOx family dehydrogenase [uncultured Halomonas sp.]